MQAFIVKRAKKAMSPSGDKCPAGAEHRIAAGDEARRAEEPAVATPKMFCALEGRNNLHNNLDCNILRLL